MWAPQLDMTEALRVEGDHLSGVSKADTVPITNGRLGLRVVELIEAATTSMRGRGETVHLQRKEKIS